MFEIVADEICNPKSADPFAARRSGANLGPARAGLPKSFGSASKTRRPIVCTAFQLHHLDWPTMPRVLAESAARDKLTSSYCSAGRWSLAAGRYKWLPARMTNGFAAAALAGCSGACSACLCVLIIVSCCGRLGRRPICILSAAVVVVVVAGWPASGLAGCCC